MFLIRNHSGAGNPGTQEDIRQVFERFFGNEERASGTAPAAAAAGQWAPRVDIREEDQRFVIFADIPGVDPAQIEVQMDKGVLSVKGERATATFDAEGKFSRVERKLGAFHRRFTLPDSADAEGISATGKHGVLEISIPKKAQSTPRRITITSSN
jgi:HSP20 family protein